MKILFVISHPESTQALIGLTNACSRRNQSFFCFFTGDGVKLLHDGYEYTIPIGTDPLKYFHIYIINVMPIPPSQPTPYHKFSTYAVNLALLLILLLLFLYALRPFLFVLMIFYHPLCPPPWMLLLHLSCLLPILHPTLLLPILLIMQ